MIHDPNADLVSKVRAIDQVVEAKSPFGSGPALHPSPEHLH